MPGLQHETVRVTTPAVPPILTPQLARALTRIIVNAAGDLAVDIADAVRPQAEMAWWRPSELRAFLEFVAGHVSLHRCSGWRVRPGCGVVNSSAFGGLT